LRLRRLRLLLKDGKRRYGVGGLTGAASRRVRWNGCFLTVGEAGPAGRCTVHQQLARRDGLRAVSWRLRSANFALEGSVLLGIFLGELVQIHAQLFILAEQNEGDERGSDRQNCE